MSDFELLKALQEESVTTLEVRKTSEYVPHNACRTKIRRLRLQIGEVMLRIERKCTSYVIMGKEGWY